MWMLSHKHDELHMNHHQSELLKLRGRPPPEVLQWWSVPVRFSCFSTRPHVKRWVDQARTPLICLPVWVSVEAAWLQVSLWVIDRGDRLFGQSTTHHISSLSYTQHLSGPHLKRQPNDCLRKIIFFLARFLFSPVNMFIKRVNALHCRKLARGGCLRGKTSGNHTSSVDTSVCSAKWDPWRQSTKINIGQTHVNV